MAERKVRNMIKDSHSVWYGSPFPPHKEKNALANQLLQKNWNYEILRQYYEIKIMKKRWKIMKSKLWQVKTIRMRDKNSNS